jgi:hypothetical protein
MYWSKQDIIDWKRSSIRHEAEVRRAELEALIVEYQAQARLVEQRKEENWAFCRDQLQAWMRRVWERPNLVHQAEADNRAE